MPKNIRKKTNKTIENKTKKANEKKTTKAITKTKRTHFKYTEEALSQAIQAIKTGNKSIRESCRLYGVPRSTVQDRISGRTLEQPRKVGPEPILGFDGEQKVVDWIIDLAKCGLPVNKELLLDTVKKIINDMGKADKLPEGKRPGQTWYQGFLRRHPEISVREPESINKAREAVRESSIRKWFIELECFLTERGLTDIMEDPERILNADETGVSLCPNTGKVLAPKGYKNVYTVKKGNEKETLTVLITMTASGKICTPLVVFPYVRPPKAVVDNMPEGWIIGKTETGWMRSDVFYEYIANDFNTWLLENNVKKPVILFVDGHKSHMSMALSQFCEENDIILYALPPNTTHITQPADVSVFKPLKQQWKKTLSDWQAKPENQNNTVTKTNFCKVFKDALDQDMTQTIKNGFRKCGLYPFNVEAVDFSKCVKDFQEKKKKRSISSSSNRLTERDYVTAQKVITTIKENLLKKGIDPEIICNEIELAKFTIKESRRSASKTPRTSTEVANSSAFKSPEVIIAPATKETINMVVDGAGCSIGNDLSYSLLDDISIPDVGSHVSLNDISVMNLSDINFIDSNDTHILNLEEMLPERQNHNTVSETPLSGNQIVVLAEIHTTAKDDMTSIKTPHMESTPIQIRSLGNDATFKDNKIDFESLPKIASSPQLIPENSTTDENSSSYMTGKNKENTPLEESHDKLTNTTEKPKENILPDPFKNHLTFLNDLINTKTRKRNIIKFPSAISSKKWRDFYESKEKEKQKKIDATNKRKTEREEKKSKAAEQKQHKNRTKTKPKTNQEVKNSKQTENIEKNTIQVKKKLGQEDARRRTEEETRQESKNRNKMEEENECEIREVICKKTIEKNEDDTKDVKEYDEYDEELEIF